MFFFNSFILILSAIILPNQLKSDRVGVKLGDFRRRLLQFEQDPNDTSTWSTTKGSGLFWICTKGCDVYCDTSCNEDCDNTKCDDDCDEQCDYDCDSCCDWESCADRSDTGTSYSDAYCDYQECNCACDEGCDDGCDEGCKQVSCDAGCNDDCDTGCDEDCADRNVSLITGGWVSYYDEDKKETIVDWDFTNRKDSGNRMYTYTYGCNIIMLSFICILLLFW